MGLFGFGLWLAGFGVFLLAGGLGGIFSDPEQVFDIGNEIAMVFSLPFLLAGSVLGLIGGLRRMHDPEGDGASSFVREDE